MRFQRSDILYVLFGENPMPNIIGVTKRIKEDGKIICIYTDRTKAIFEKFKQLIDEKNNTEKLRLKLSGILLSNTASIFKVEKEIREKISLKEVDDKILELNFTGGTSVISTIAFDLFKEYSKVRKVEIIFSYLDTESTTINLSKVEESCEEELEAINFHEIEDLFTLKTKDLIFLHNDYVSDATKVELEDIKVPLLVENILREILVSKDNAIKFTNTLYYGTRKLNDKYKKAKIEKTPKDLQNDILKVLNIIFNNENGYKWSFFRDKNDLFLDFKTVKTFELKEVLKCINGFWFEDYIVKLCLELRDEGIIKEVFSSVIRRFEKSEDFEVDVVINTNSGLKILSITTTDDFKIATKKLYEAKIRGNQLGGDEVQIGFISFCDKKEFLNIQNDYWKKENFDDFILGYEDILNAKNLIKEWIIK